MIKLNTDRYAKLWTAFPAIWWLCLSYDKQLWGNTAYVGLVCGLHDHKWLDGKPNLKDFSVLWSALDIGAISPSMQPERSACWQCFQSASSPLCGDRCCASGTLIVFSGHPPLLGSFVVWVHMTCTRRASRALITSHAWVAPPHRMMH